METWKFYLIRGGDIKISWKKGSKSGLHDPRILLLLFGTKNHEMQGPPVLASVTRDVVLCLVSSVTNKLTTVWTYWDFF
jgi:hypothetical protein